MFNNYLLKNLIGAGTYGDIKLAFDKVNKKDVAIKIIKIFNLNKSTIKMIINEILIGYFNNCEYLVKIIDFFIIENIVYLVMPFYNQIDYKNYTRNHNKNSSSKIELILRILLGIQYLHVNKIIHRDIKIDNVMMNNNQSFLGDFGICNILPENKYFASTCIGTPYYLSPEIIEGNNYNTKVDIYSLGCMLCEIFYNKPPYTGKNIYLLYKNVIKSNKCIDINNNIFIDNLINKMIKKKSINRPLINEIIELYTNNYNLKYKLYRKDIFFSEIIRTKFKNVSNINDLNFIFTEIKKLKNNNNIL